MGRDYEIGMLWVEGPLSYVEVLCAQSFLDAGHHVKLYHYKDVQNVPDGVELIHGDSVLKIDRFIQHGRTGSFALFSDVFRYHLLKQHDRMIWADLDAYCVKPFETATGHFFGWESDAHINGGVLGLPPDSDALRQLLEMTEDEFGIPEWYSDREKKRLQKLKDQGNPVHVSDMPWGVWGPQAVTHYLQKTGEDKYAFPIEGLYPVSFRDRRLLMRTQGLAAIEEMLRENTYSVHFYGRRVREFLADIGGMPEPRQLDGPGLEEAQGRLRRRPGHDPRGKRGSQRGGNSGQHQDRAALAHGKRRRKPERSGGPVRDRQGSVQASVYRTVSDAVPSVSSAQDQRSGKWEF